jgi:hypothetical protein
MLGENGQDALLEDAEDIGRGPRPSGRAGGIVRFLGQSIRTTT